MCVCVCVCVCEHSHVCVSVWVCLCVYTKIGDVVLEHGLQFSFQYREVNGRLLKVPSNMMVRIETM